MHKSNRAREAGLVAALIIAVVISYILFSSPGIEVVADGTYEATIELLRLSPLPQTKSAQQSSSTTQFSYQAYGYSSLLIPGTPFIAYPAAVVRLLTQPFGLDFSTWMLALVYIGILALSTYLLVSGLYLHSRLGAVAAAAGMVVLFMQTSITGYLVSLYDIGAVITAFALYIGCLVHALCMPRGAGTRHAFGVILSGLLLICAQAQMTLLSPFIAVGMLLTARHSMPKGPRSAVHVVICAGMLFICVSGTLAMYNNSIDIHSDSANYLAVFQGYLPVSPNAQADLAEFGLDETYVEDVGRSYYEDSENFVHDPHSEAEQEALLSKITTNDRIAFCLKNPQRIADRINQLDAHFHSANNQRIFAKDGQTSAERLSPYLLLDLIMRQKGFAPLSARMLVAAALCLLLAFIHKGSGLNKLMISLSALMLGLMCYLPVCVGLTGGVDIDRIKVIFIFFSWAAFFVACVVGASLVQHVCMWLSQTDLKLRVETLAPALETSTSSGGAFARIHVSRTQLLWGSAIVSVAIVAMLLAPQSHVGGVNNGDFGRMMEQLDLYWTPELLENSGEQMQTKIIEEYTYRESFRPQSLTPVDPTYSLIFPSMIVRAYSAVTGAGFSTWLLAWIMLGFTIAGILLIIYDLYPLLGRTTFLLAAALIAMLLGENYVAWYNSLYGESSISMGLVMLIACAVHLCTMPRGSKRSIIWLLLLALSVRFLTCAKAQLLLALPMGLALIAALAWYHKPKQTASAIAIGVAVVLMMGGVSWDTVGVYQKNEDVSSRQTVWQSVFYGALMIADDPKGAMEELGIDPALAPDIGKHAYYPEDDYVYSFNSAEMDEAFFDHVDTMIMVKYYLFHPKDLLHMLDRAAQESVVLHTGFMAYSDELYQDHERLYRFNLWQNIRSITAGHAFWQYVLAYGALGIYLIKTMLSKKAKVQNKLFALLLLCMMLIGVTQYPLTVIGNGFADNNKQLYGFMLCHDLVVVAVITLGIHRLYRHVRKKEEEQLVPALESEGEA